MLREIADGQGLEQVVRSMVAVGPLAGAELTGTRVHACDFYCRCTREMFVGRLVALPAPPATRR